MRSRSFQALAGVLLGIAGLAATGLENVSFGHEHVTGGHAHRHHSHFYFGPHEHHDDDLDHGHGEEPAPHHHHGPAPRKGAITVSASPTLFQPAFAGVPVLPPAAWTSGVLPAVPRLAAQHASRQAPSRAPPLVPAAPDSLA